MLRIGIDLGGTNIVAGVVNDKYEIIAKAKTPTAMPRTPEEIFDDIAMVCKQAMAEAGITIADIYSVGLGTPGTANAEGVIEYANNLGFDHVPAKEMLIERLGCDKVYIENDANCAAWAEHVIGASKGYKYSVMLTLGTGVGGGIILDNKLYKGKSGAAGEMHFKMTRTPQRHCTCGSWDCFEAYASGTGLKLTAEDISENKEMTTYDVIDGLKAKDELMTKIFNTWQDDILNGIIGLANIFDPDVVVLSGSMAEFVDTGYLTEETNRQIVTQPTKVVKAQAGNYSGMIGAGLLALGVEG